MEMATLKLSTQEFEALFNQFSNTEFSTAINQEAKDLMKEAENSEQFRAVTGGFFQKVMKSVSLGGIEFKVTGMIMLVAFLMGYKYATENGAKDPPLDQAAIDKFLKDLDPDNQK
jgi:hypothetical protein